LHFDFPNESGNYDL